MLLIIQLTRYALYSTTRKNTTRSEEYRDTTSTGGGARGHFTPKNSRISLEKNSFVFKKGPSKIRINPLVLKKSRTLFPMNEVPLAGRGFSAKFQVGECHPLFQNGTVG